MDTIVYHSVGFRTYAVTLEIHKEKFAMVKQNAPCLFSDICVHRCQSGANTTMAERLERMS